jgi:hypothetical protein
MKLIYIYRMIVVALLCWITADTSDLNKDPQAVSIFFGLGFCLLSVTLVALLIIWLMENIEIKKRDD